MRPALLLELARVGADRRRQVVTAGATAAAGTLLLAAARIARTPVADPTGADVGGPPAGLAAYVTEAGLRPGVVVAAVLLAVPVLALSIQALRVGSPGRDRAMSALRLAGATPGEVRSVAAVQSAVAAGAGGVLAGPGYLAAWVALGVVTPAGWRLLPAPDGWDALAWPVVVALLAVAGAAAGAAVQSRVATDPLRVHRRVGAHAEPGRAGRAALAAGLLLVAASLAAMGGLTTDLGGSLVLAGLVLGCLVVAAAGGRGLVLARGRALTRRGDAASLLAGARLAADPGSSARVAAVLVLCGLVAGVASAFAAGLLVEPVQGPDLAFYLVGSGVAVAGVLLAAVVAVLTLVVGAVDQLLGARRPIACLAALGTEQSVLVAAVRRQLVAAAAAPVAAGALLGGGVAVLWQLAGSMAASTAAVAVAVAAVLATAGVAAVLVAGVASLTARVLGPAVRSAADPQHLRVAG